MTSAYCLRITWKYYDKTETEVYLKQHKGFGALHHGDQDNLHSHYYIFTSRSNKDLRNDINRYKTTYKAPKGFRALTIQSLKTTEGQYYRYVCTKSESSELWINDMDIPEFTPIVVKTTSRKQPSIIEQLLQHEPIQLASYNYAEVCGLIIDWYISRFKCLPMDGIMKQICRTVWLHLIKKKDEENGSNDYVKLRDKYVRGICCDNLGVLPANYCSTELKTT